MLLWEQELSLYPIRHILDLINNSFCVIHGYYGKLLAKFASKETRPKWANEIRVLELRNKPSDDIDFRKQFVWNKYLLVFPMMNTDNKICRRL